jgi:type IV secretory pathway TraG/TraD family ATPase VirD4
MLAANWWNPVTWIQNVAGFFHGAYDAGGAVLNALGGVLTILTQFFRLNNHGCKVILPGISDPETADVLGKLVGRMDFTEQQVSLGADGRISRSYSTRHDSMATPDALRQLSAGSAIVIHRDSPPAFVNLPYWFQRARYRRLAKVPYFRAAEHVPR